MVLVVVGLSALIAMGGLALDTAHVYLNTARLQTALDAAALAGAKTLDQSTSTVVATAAAQSVFASNVANYPELKKAGVTLVTQFSASNNPFTAGTTPAAFVKTSVTGFQTGMSVVSVLGIPSISVAGAAVAGPSASVANACNLTPLVMCANPASPAPYFGYAADQVVGLTQLTTTSTTAGVGNYVVLNTGSTAAANALAGDYTGCATAGTVVSTVPGTAGTSNTSVCSGLNTRFNNYTGFSGSSTKYPPDSINSPSHCTGLTTVAGHVCQGSTQVTTASQLSFNHATYCSLNQSQTYDTTPISPATSGGTGSFNRRVVPVALADCSGSVNGKTNATVLGFACLFMLQQVSTSDKSSTIYGQVLSSCNTRGKPSNTTSASTGPHTIQLYHSAGSKDS